MKGITPFLWFDTQAEEAVRFYTSVFKDSKVGAVSRHEGVEQGPKSSVLVITFYLNGQEFMALNGGPMFKFSPATSFMVNCETQAEVDELWEKLSEGGQKQQCGWLQDKYGMSWQIIPTRLGELMSHPDPAKAKRVMNAMLQMTKIDIKQLEEA